MFKFFKQLLRIKFNPLSINFSKIIFSCLFGLLLTFLWSCNQNNGIAQEQFNLDLPVKCRPGENCFILLYSDRDKSDQARDFTCGFMTYDGHKGTDFAIPSTKVMEKGVPVVASASGKVLRIRDGVEDKRFTGEDNADIENQECGNGVIIDHGNGWQTQYCHLRQGSVNVQPNDEVKVGQQIGLVGMSGLASFPHVHLQVSYQNEIIDPFVGVTSNDDCEGENKPLWREILAYQPTGLIRAGFASKAPEQGDLWEGKFSTTTLSRDIPSLLFWIQLYGVLPDDQEFIQLINPQGQVVSEFNQKTGQQKKLWLRYIGQKSTTNAFLPGEWRGKYQLKRAGKVLIDIDKIINLD